MNALVVKNLTVSFMMYERGFRRHPLRVISDLNISVREGEIIAVVGGSGSGKSLLAHAILGILPKNAVTDGEITWFDAPLTPELQQKLRGNGLSLVPQSVTYLDPLMRVGKQISKDKKIAVSALKKYGLGESVAKFFPFELSGGMARRALVATADAANAKVIIADEPTPGLSEELARSAMASFRELADSGTAILLITHDIDLAVRFADRIAVFYAGTTVETADASDFSDESLLRHPYSRALWRAMPQNGFSPTPGTQPYAGNLPPGCPYAPRCPLKTDECEKAQISRTVRNGEVSCCHAN